MVLARLALAEGILSQARTESSVLFLSKAFETTVHVTAAPLEIQLLHSTWKHSAAAGGHPREPAGHF